MKVGDLIKWSNPKIGGGWDFFVGLVVAVANGDEIKVRFNGFKYLRWVSAAQCEVLNENR